jgi:hypothetical protein
LNLYLYFQTEFDLRIYSKKKKAGAWAAAERRWWAAGPPGQKGGEGKFLFFFSFSNSFQINLYTQIQIKFLLNLS